MTRRRRPLARCQDVFEEGHFHTSTDSGFNGNVFMRFDDRPLPSTAWWMFYVQWRKMNRVFLMFNVVLFRLRAVLPCGLLKATWMNVWTKVSRIRSLRNDAFTWGRCLSGSLTAVAQCYLLRWKLLCLTTLMLSNQFHLCIGSSWGVGKVWTQCTERSLE